VHSYGVTADIALPGWWPYTDFCAETAWVTNWQNTPTVLKGASTCGGSSGHAVKRVRFPLTDASLEAVTNFVAAGHLGSEASPATLSVSYVTPTVVPSCTSTVVFEIGGSDIWQTDRAYLGGVRADTVEVLPDMKGISAKFDMNAVFGALVNTDSSVQKVPLVVASKQGTSTTLPIYVVGKRQSANGATMCQSPILLPTTTDILPPTVVDVTPHEVCSGIKDLYLSVQGLNMPKTIEARGGGLTSAASSSDRDDDVQRIIKLSSAKGLTPGSLAVALSGKNFAYGVTLTVNDCSPSKDKSSGSKKAPATTSGKKKEDPKATLVTKSVKLAANQPVHVTVKIPDSYAEVVLGVRTTGGIWLNSSPLSPTPGDAADVGAVFDLSKLNAKAGGSLEVRVKIRTRPGVEAQKIPADNPLPIDAAS
jgi:hypothetical protein